MKTVLQAILLRIIPYFWKIITIRYQFYLLFKAVSFILRRQMTIKIILND